MKKTILTIGLSLTMLFSFSTKDHVEANSDLNGWHLVEENHRYYQNGNPLTGLQTIGNTTYLFDANGNKQYGWHVVDGRTLYLSPENGGMLTGLRTINNTTYLLTAYGKSVGWHNLDGNHYYFNTENGGRLTGLQRIGQTTYLLTVNGKETGWKNLDGNHFYFDPSHGGKLTGLRTINNSTYLLTRSGKATGWHNLEDNHYYFDVNKNSIAAKGLYDINGDTYLFNESGIKQTGWKTVDGKSYYFDPEANGAMVVGKRRINTNTYYFNEEGQQVTGWVTIGSARYYFSPARNGRMVTGRQTIDGKTYVFNSNGTFVGEYNPALYSLRDLQYHGVIRWNGYKFTYYSQSVLPGYGLRIPGRHVNANGYVADKDGYIVLAAAYGVPKGTVYNTPFGSKGKVYDTCAACSVEWLDVYTR